MKKRGKNYQAVQEKFTAEAADFGTAVTVVQENSRKSFDETVELHINLGIDPEKSEQMVRGQATLPSGSVKEKKVVVVDSKNGEDLIAQIKTDGTIDADVVVATPDMMPKLAQVAKVLGPKGLMPNPKNGTVTPNPEEFVKELQGGKISFKMDVSGNIHEPIGKASWEASKIVANAEALLKAVAAAQPATAKGKFIKTVSLCSTMGPSIKVAS